MEQVLVYKDKMRTDAQTGGNQKCKQPEANDANTKMKIKGVLEHAEKLRAASIGFLRTLTYFRLCQKNK